MFSRMSLLLCSHGYVLPLVPSPFPPPRAGDQARQGFLTGLSSLCPLVHTFFLSTCFLLPGHPGLWVLWRLTDKDISCFVLLSLVRRKPRVDTFRESGDVEWDHGRTGRDGMRWGQISKSTLGFSMSHLIWELKRLKTELWIIPSVLSKLGAYNLAKVETQGFNLGKSRGDRCRGRRVIWSIYPKYQWWLLICGFRARKLGLPGVTKMLPVSRNLLLICFLKM